MCELKVVADGLQFQGVIQRFDILDGIAWVAVFEATGGIVNPVREFWIVEEVVEFHTAKSND